MANVFLSIKQGLTEAVEFSKGKPCKAAVHELRLLEANKNLRASRYATKRLFTTEDCK